MIEIQDLKKIYDMGKIQVPALNGVDVKIMKGEFVAIMGPSGSGKSTLMNILGCLDRPTVGTYLLDGEDVGGLDKNQLAEIRNRKLGFVFQSYNLLPRLDALENVILPLIYDVENRYSTEQKREKAVAALERVGLESRMDHLPTELSGGQQQRVAIARALINDPILILADEPTGNLDSRSGDEIMEILLDLHGNGSTIVMVTHEPEIAAYTQRTIHFRDGIVETVLKNGKDSHAEAEKTTKEYQVETRDGGDE
ncbi:MAG: ABC transporter ATP-binding protein [Anaerolineaceae bacterium]|nr:ABC transporter ATP-binding protein [Anaerolineaceae bacterium]